MSTETEILHGFIYIRPFFKVAKVAVDLVTYKYLDEEEDVEVFEVEQETILPSPLVLTW